MDYYWIVLEYFITKYQNVPISWLRLYHALWIEKVLARVGLAIPAFPTDSLQETWALYFENFWDSSWLFGPTFQYVYGCIGWLVVESLIIMILSCSKLEQNNTLDAVLLVISPYTQIQ